MYNVATIKSGMLTTVGWRQNDDPNGVQISSLTTSDSGYYYNDAHPLLTIQNLESIAPDFVSFGDSGAAFNTSFTDWLQQKTEAGILDVVGDWFHRKFKQRTAQSLIERNRLFTGTGSNSELIANADKFVGLEFDVHRSLSTRAKFTQIGIQLSANQDIVIYLFKSGNANAIKQETFSYTGAGDLQWFTPSTDWVMQGEGSYLLAYDQGDLSGQALNGAYDRTFNRPGMKYFPCGRYIKATAFSVPQYAVGVGTQEVENTLIVGGSEFNTLEMDYSLTENFGLNADIQVYCDYTDLITEQKTLFAQALQLRVAMNLLRELAYNPNSRINRHENNVQREQVLYEIDGNPQGISSAFKVGIGARYEEALNAIKFDTTNIDPLCLPCRPRGGVKYGTV